MTARFTVLASGSAGNASLLETDSGGLLVDFGLNAKQLGTRLNDRGYSWRNVDAAVLTHTHGDHWRDSALSAFLKHQVTVYCHPGHALELMVVSEMFGKLRAAGLVRTYEPSEWCEPVAGVRARPLPVPHDGGPTCAFRFEGPDGLFGPKWALGYATDLGSWNDQLASDLADVDVLAIEFNHDVELQRASGRPKMLIDRVLGDAGHLSNRQAAGLLQATRERSKSVGLRYLIGLHPSRQCNSIDLAHAAALEALAGDPINIVFACQHEPTQIIEVRPGSKVTPRTGRAHSRSSAVATGAGFFDENA